MSIEFEYVSNKYNKEKKEKLKQQEQNIEFDFSPKFNFREKETTKTKKRKELIIESEDELGNSDSEENEEKIPSIDVSGAKFINLKKIECDTNLPDSVVLNIRKYLDLVYGLFFSLIEKKVTPLQTIPLLITKILDYNNIRFKNIRFFKNPFSSNKDEFEHIDYYYSLDPDDPFLFIWIDEEKIKTFCSDSISPIPIKYECQLIPIQKFNPYKSSFDAKSQEYFLEAATNCIIISDHAAQHLINSITHDLKGEPISLNQPIHYNFTKYGTTIHSIFKLTELNIKDPKTISTSDFLLSKLW